MTARSVTIPIPGHGCMDDLSSGRSLDLQTAWVIDVFGQFFGDNYRLGFSLS